MGWEESMRRCGELTENDRRQLERFAVYLRLVNQAVKAGVPSAEAQVAIHDDVYHDAGEDASRKR